MNSKRIFREIRGLIITVLVSILLLSIINTKVFAMAKVQQKSMENTGCILVIPICSWPVLTTWFIGQLRKMRKIKR